VDTTYFTLGSVREIILVYPGPPPIGFPVGFGSAPYVALDSEMGIVTETMISPIMRIRSITSVIIII